MTEIENNNTETKVASTVTKKKTPTKRVTKTTTKTNTKKAESKTEEVPKVSEETISIKQPKTFAPDTPILCKSLTFGELIYIGVNNYRYEWGGYGDIREIPYQDIMSLKSKKSAFLYNPWIMIEDEDLLERDDFKRDFSEMYKLYKDFESPDEFFNCSPSEMEEKLQNAPSGFKTMISSCAAGLIKEERLDSLSMINKIDTILGTDLKFLID